MIWIWHFLFIVADGAFNRYRIVTRGQINHTVNVFYRIGFGLFMTQVYHVAGLQLMCWALGAFFSFKLLFDIEVNLLNHKSIGYVGDTSWMDRLQNKIGLPWVATTFWEAVLAAGMISAYYNTDLL